MLDYKKLLALIFIKILLVPLTFAEGSRELLANNCNNHGSLQIWDNNDINRPFASYNAPPEHRLYVRMVAGETMYYGFGGVTTNGSTGANDVWVRIKDPNGNIVVPAWRITGNNNTAGLITQCSRAINGPFAGNQGYSPLVYQATMSGDYYFEFAINNDSSMRQKRVINFFDISVRHNATNKPGRVWSKAWDLTTNGSANEFRATMFAYSSDSVVTKFIFNGIQPFGFQITCNSYGASNVGPYTERRKSDYRQNIINAGGSPGAPEYPIFLNDPDVVLFPTGSVGLVSNYWVDECVTEENCINIVSTKQGQVEVELNFSNGTRRTLIENILGGNNCVLWDGLDGNGGYLGAGDTVGIIIRYQTGITHLPLIDVEDHLNGYTVELVRPLTKPDNTPLPAPRIFWNDTLLIDPQNSLDGMVNLTGCVGGNCHQWRNRGVNNSNPEVINTWWYANMENYSFTVVCPLFLNVDLEFFRGSNSITGNTLVWQTAAEDNMVSFEVMRSTNGKDFKKIGTLEAKNEPAFYRFDDEEFSGSYAYYKLLINGLQDYKKYSEVIKIKNHYHTIPQFSFNPNSQSFRITNTKNVAISFEIFDTSGRVLKKSATFSNEIINIDLEKGLYIIKYKIENQSEIYSNKFIIH